MNFKNIIALALVFSLAFALASCKKEASEAKNSGSGFEKVSEVKVVDEKGEEHTLATQINEDTGETEYFYEDNSGNVVTVKAKEAEKGGKTEFYVVNEEGEEVSVETTVKEKVVTVPRTRRSEGLGEDATGQTVATNGYTDVSLTPEQESFIAKFSDANPENFTDNNGEKAAQQMKLGTAERSNTVDLSKLENDPAASSRKKFEDVFSELASKNAYTLKVVIREKGGNSTYNIPITIAKNGDKMYAETSYPFDEANGGTMTMKAYLNKDKAAVYIPNIKGTFTINMKEEEFTNLLNSVKEGSGSNSKSDENYMGSIKAGSLTYDYYGTENNYLAYMYEGNTLKRMEQVSKNKEGKITSSEITEIVQLSNSADSKLFDEPSGYINMDNMAADFDIEKAVKDSMNR